MWKRYAIDILDNCIDMHIKQGDIVILEQWCLQYSLVNIHGASIVQCLIVIYIYRSICGLALKIVYFIYDNFVQEVDTAEGLRIVVQYYMFKLTNFDMIISSWHFNAVCNSSILCTKWEKSSLVENCLCAPKRICKHSLPLFIANSTFCVLFHNDSQCFICFFKKHKMYTFNVWWIIVSWVTTVS